MKPRSKKALLVVLGAVACGPSAPPEAPPSPPTEPQAAPSPAAPGSGTQAGTEPPPAAPKVPRPAGMPEHNTPIQASKLFDDLKKANIPLSSPTLEKMALGDKKRLMPFFVKALGYKDCAGCHASLSDYKTTTRNMQLTRGMWANFVAKMNDHKGGAVFCDSCHAGQSKVLDRSDKDRVKKFMETDYVGKLKRADKKDVECATCHGDAMELSIFAKLWNVK
jgi:hypothetical protein